MPEYVLPKPEDILFQTKPVPFKVELKRILIMGIGLMVVNTILHSFYLHQLIGVFLIIGLLDMFTFYLPGRARSYIITDKSFFIKRMSKLKEYPFSEIGNISAAKGKILVVSVNGKILGKISEAYIDPAVRKEFKDVLFQQMERNSPEGDVVSKYS